MRDSLVGVELVRKRRRLVQSREATLARLSTLAPGCDYNSAKLARTLDISQRHLHRLFAAALACSPGSWLKEQRLHRARHLLASARSVKEVAYVLGFRHVSQFSRDFRKRFGMTPSDLIPDDPTPMRR
jgi:AraC-like DNA-binding protein